LDRFLQALADGTSSGEGDEWVGDADDSGGDGNVIGGQQGGGRGGGRDGGEGAEGAGKWGAADAGSSGIVRFTKETLHCIPEGREEDGRSSVGSAEVGEANREESPPCLPQAEEAAAAGFDGRKEEMEAEF